MPIIKFNDVWEMYRIKFIIEGKPSWENFWALRGINFSLEKGELLGIIGENGSGKSTILRLVAGMLKPDRGQIDVSGNVAGLLELGAGFQAELTGRENVSLQFELFGLHAEQGKYIYQEVINFAEIGKFIDAPVKCYSQGMFVRLAFAIAIHMDPDIFLVDDTLAVGDEYFQRKCIKEIFKIKQRGKTVIIVTHDMSMLQKLCARTIFLKQGILIKDEETSKAVSFYSQVAGSPKGIAIIKHGQLNLVFNNGRLLLSWNGKLLTSPQGGYVTFSLANRWYHSNQAEWEIKEEAEGMFTVAGRFYQLGLTQLWRIAVGDELEIKWDVELKIDAEIELSEMNVNLFLKEEYAHWFADNERGDFPPIKDEDKNYYTVFAKNALSACIGVLELNDTPSLLFEELSLGCSVQSSILNSDYLSHCRILQYKLNPNYNRSSGQSDQFICFAGKIIVNTPDVGKYIAKAQDEFILSVGDTKLTFDNGRCILEYKGIKLTEGSHISTSIYANGKWYFSDAAQWALKKQDNRKIIATGKWPNLPLIQVWEIEADNENLVKWDVYIQLEEALIIEQQYFSIAASSKYSHWFSDYGSGVFPAGFRETGMDMPQICLPAGTLGISNQDVNMPELKIRFSDESHNYAKIINSNFYEKVRKIYLAKIEPETAGKFLPGKLPCFKLSLCLEKDKQIFSLGSNEIENNGLKLILDNGSGHIFWQGKELTKRLGLYTSLLSKNRWHDSASSARWRIVKINKNLIKAAGDWLYLPITQSWEIEIEGTDSINLMVKTQVKNAIEIESLQTNLMLSERYSKWLKENQAQNFPDFSKDVDDKWDLIYSINGQRKIIGLPGSVENGFVLPDIFLSAEESNSCKYLNIVNSDVYHRARVLQCLSPTDNIVSAGEYLCFNGKITLVTVK